MSQKHDTETGISKNKVFGKSLRAANIEKIHIPRKSRHQKNYKKIRYQENTKWNIKKQGTEKVQKYK